MPLKRRGELARRHPAATRAAAAEAARALRDAGRARPRRAARGVPAAAGGCRHRHRGHAHAGAGEPRRRARGRLALRPLRGRAGHRVGCRLGRPPNKISLFRLPLETDFPDPTSSRKRSASRSSTSWPTTPASTTTASTSSTSTDARRRRRRAWRGRQSPVAVARGVRLGAREHRPVTRSRPTRLRSGTLTVADYAASIHARWQDSLSALAPVAVCGLVSIMSDTCRRGRRLATGDAHAACPDVSASEPSATLGDCRSCASRARDGTSSDLAVHATDSGRSPTGVSRATSPPWPDGQPGARTRRRRGAAASPPAVTRTSRTYLRTCANDEKMTAR